MHPRRKARIGVLEAVYAESQIHEKPEKILKDVFLRDEYGKDRKSVV